MTEVFGDYRNFTKGLIWESRHSGRESKGVQNNVDKLLIFLLMHCLGPKFGLCYFFSRMVWIQQLVPNYF